MKLKTLSIVLMVSLIFTAGSAQAAFWRGELPGGIFVVSLPTVTSVSTHEYVVDGMARVTELTVDTTGQIVARFYYIEPLVAQTPGGVGQALIDKAQQKLTQAAERAGVEEVWKKVVKNYPNTTHARTVEYRLDSIAQITRLQKSLEAAWRANQETQIKVAATEEN